MIPVAVVLMSVGKSSPIKMWKTGRIPKLFPNTTKAYLATGTQVKLDEALEHKLIRWL
jgi:hypothetical protein